MHLKASFVLRCAIRVGIRGGLYDGFGAALGIDMYQRASVLGCGFADGFCNTYMPVLDMCLGIRLRSCDTVGLRPRRLM